MPPPMPNPSKRMTANPARPVQRYRPGKAVAQEESEDEEEDDEDEQVEDGRRQSLSQSQQVRRRQQPPQSRAQRQQQIVADDQSEDEDEEGFVTEDEDAEDGGVALVKSTIVQRGGISNSGLGRSGADKLGEIGSEEEEDEDDGSESEDDVSSEEDEASSEDEPQRKFQRPTFIKKSDRNNNAITASQLATSADTPTIVLGDNNASIPQPAPEEDELARRRAETEALIRDRIERDVLARAAGKKSWDDDDEVAPENTVDDTDGLDREAEYAAWKLRELKRLKRDREAIETREREIEELERRRNLTVEERDREDKEFISKQKDEREAGRGQTAYLARYHHKGAFFQDDEAAEVLRKRDIMGAKFVDEVDKERLPEYMRIRDMTKLGKKGRTRYTDLKGQDTGAFGNDVMRWRPGDGPRTGHAGGGGEFGTTGGMDERFLPDRDREGHGFGRRSDTGPTGANASAVGERKSRPVRSRSRSPRRRRDVETTDSYRPGRRRSSSYSRSPARRKRSSSSPDRDKDKRRRIDAV